MRYPKIFILIYCLFLSSFSIYGEIELSDENREVLEELGLSLGVSEEELEANLEVVNENLDVINEVEDADVNDLDQRTENLQSNVRSQIDVAKLELQKKMKKEVEVLKKSVKEDFIPGLALSITSMMATAVVGPLIGAACYNQPSVQVYGATAVYYLLRELSIWKTFKIGTMLNLKRMEKVNISEDISLAENLENGASFAHAQLNYIDIQLKLVETGFKAIKAKAGNARKVSYGYAIAGGLAIWETYGSAGGVCEGIVYNTNGQGSDGLLARINPIEFLIPGVQAAKNEALDYVGDFDKLGIVAGGLISAGVFIAIFSGYFKGFVKLLKNGVTRSVLFLANSALAFAAAKKLDKAVNLYLNRIEKIKKITKEFRVMLGVGVNEARSLMEQAQELVPIAEQFGITIDKKISEMTPREIKALIEEIESKANGELPGVDQSKLNDLKKILNLSSAKKMRLEAKEPKNYFTHYLKKTFDLLFGNTMAATCRDGKGCQKFKAPKLPKGAPHYNSLQLYRVMADSFYARQFGQEEKAYFRFGRAYPIILKVNEKLKSIANNKNAENGQSLVNYDELIEKYLESNNKRMQAIHNKGGGLKITPFDTALIKNTKVNNKKNGDVSGGEKSSLSVEALISLKEVIERRMKNLQQDNSKNYIYSEISNQKSQNIFKIISRRYLISGKSLFPAF